MVGIALRRSGQKNEPDDERLLKLFRNRTELKKEFAKLRREGERLQEALQQQEGATLRSQQQLEKLEGMLSHPVQAANASVFYQLRGVWSHCRRKLTKLGEDLLAHQRDREMNLDLNRFNAAKNAALAVIERHEAQAREQYDAVSSELESLSHRLINAGGFWNYFRRRAIASQIEAVTESRQTAARQLALCQEQKQAKAAEPPPSFGGLTVAGRRKINLVIIAIAQELFLHFSKRDISKLAREASVRQVSDVNYGDITACRNMNIRIEKCLRSLPTGQDLVSRARHRVAYLENCAAYRLETDTVPVAGSFAEIPLRVGDGGDIKGQSSVSVNVLADEYWEVYSILLT